jgi:hypothetical protein
MAIFNKNILRQVSGFDNQIIADEWHEIKALEDDTVFVNVFSESKR